MQPRGSIFRYWFLDEVLFKFQSHGVVFKMVFYYKLNSMCAVFLFAKPKKSMNVIFI